MSWLLGRFRTGTPGSAAATGAAASDESGGQFRVSDTPGTPLPLDPAPAHGPIGTLYALAMLAGNPNVAGLWFFDDSTDGYKDLAWRWQHHDALLHDPDVICSIDAGGTLFNWAPYTPEVGGGDGTLSPYIALEYADNVGSDRVVDVTLAPVWTLIVDWQSLGPVEPSGTPAPIPPYVDPSVPKPAAVRIAPQTIVANSHDNVWELYIPEQIADWLGGAGDWTLDYEPALAFTWSGGGGGTPETVQTSDGRFIYHGPTLLEFDNVAQLVTMYGQGTLGGWELIGATPMLPTGAPGGFPAEPGFQVLGAGTLGPSFLTFFVHINGYVKKLAVIADTAQNSVKLLGTTGPLPGTEPSGSQGAEFRVAAPAVAVGSYADSAHYWPLDDAASPMVDVIAGSNLEVQDAGGDVTYQAPGIVVAAEPTHTTAVRLGGVVAGSGTSFTTNTYLDRTGAPGPEPSLGPGGAGNDFAIGCWLQWEGPIASLGSFPIVASSQVPYGFALETAIEGFIGPGFAEPFGIGFDTWDATHHVFDQLRTSELDWPADLQLTGLVPSKVPTWALLMLVYRTTDTITPAVQKEIWLDGVLVAAGSADPDGWGADVHLARVGGGLIASMQHLATWPFAPTAAEIAGLAGSRND